MVKLVYVSLTLPLEYKQALTGFNQRITQDLDQHQIKYNQYDEDSLHMTIAFIGHKLKSVSKDVYLKLNRIIEQYSQHLLNLSFEFSHFDYFPESKRNLIVAVYEPSETALNFITALKTEINNLDLLTEDASKFVCHITLGKIISKDAHIFNWEHFRTNLPHIEPFRAEGCHLCGFSHL